MMEDIWFWILAPLWLAVLFILAVFIIVLILMAHHTYKEHKIYKRRDRKHD